MMDYYLAFKKERISPIWTSLMNPEDIRLSEISQSCKDKCHFIPHI